MNAQVIYLRRSWRSVLPSLVLAVAVGVIGVMTVDQEFLFAPLNLGQTTFNLPLLLLLFLVLLIRPLMLLKDQRHEITEHHLRASSGLFSMRRHDVTLPFEDIRGVRADQNILERMLAVGSVLAWNHSADHPEVVMTGISHPRLVAKILSDRVDQAILRAKAKKA